MVLIFVRSWRLFCPDHYHLGAGFLSVIQGHVVCPLHGTGADPEGALGARAPPPPAWAQATHIYTVSKNQSLYM